MGGWGGLKPPGFKLMLLCVRAVTAKQCLKFRKAQEEKKLSGYKQCYTKKKQSLEVSKYMNSFRFLLCATNLI